MNPRQRIEVMDTTLRDGEQTAGVSFNAGEKLTIAKLLLRELKVNRIEVASARVSLGEQQALTEICSWAAQKGFLDSIEVLGLVDGNLSVDWISSCGCKVVNILCKGSLRHVTKQLRKSPQEHLNDILQVIDYAHSKDMVVNVYLEDWSNGMIDSRDYVAFLVDGLKDKGVKRFMLPDTLGILNPDQTYEFCCWMLEKWPDLHFDFHAHNDYDLAVANTYAAIKAGFQGIHATVNGLGERTGNAPVSSLVAIMNDHLHVENTLDEGALMHVCRYVESISGIRIPS
ncbi:MAG: 2-isopropylmalate synthase, partial [Bacteroidales bacterium]|nr:2-isopropylmalate synthase [Bacteroidales bacterium]